MSDSLKISPVKGRPMLHWVGKTSPRVVHLFPAQLCEAYNLKHPPEKPIWTALEPNWCNLLFHGDNKEILSTLLVNGFREKIDLIYIDPPFNTGEVDYVRHVQLRGITKKIASNDNSVLEDLQYKNNFYRDKYLQHIYERLVLLKELLSESGSIFFRIDYHYGHYVRILMDEVFGYDAFRNEIIVNRTRTLKGETARFHSATDTILFYAQDKSLFNGYRVLLPKEEWKWVDMHMVGKRKNEKLLTIRVNGISFKAPQGRRWILSQDAVDNAVKQGLVKINEKKNMPVFLNKYYSPGSNWSDIPGYSKKYNYPTENSEEVLERVIKCTTTKASLVLDCFCGSGTTAAVAEKLGRRWIVADINRGAIQTTIKRLQTVIQQKVHQPTFEQKSYGFASYRVNNYDFKEQNSLRSIVVDKYGIEEINSDLFFDGIAGGKLVKIAPLNRPLSPLDIQLIDDELHHRLDEERDIILIGNGSEHAVLEQTGHHNRVSALNRVQVVDIQRDGLMVFSPAQAMVRFKLQGAMMEVTIADYLSPSILGRLALDRTLFEEDIGDFRAQIDCIMLDSDYDGTSFRITQSDIPVNKTEFIKGHYMVTLPRPEACVAVKIIDLLGEEVWAFSSETQH